MYYSRHDTGLDTSTRLSRERTAYPPAGFNPPLPRRPLTYPPTHDRCSSLSLPLSLSGTRDRFPRSPSPGNCYRAIQPRMQIAALSRVSRMTFDEIRFRGKEEETRMSLSSSAPAIPAHTLSAPISASDSAPTSHSDFLPAAAAAAATARRKIYSLQLLANLSNRTRRPETRDSHRPKQSGA